MLMTRHGDSRKILRERTATRTFFKASGTLANIKTLTLKGRNNSLN